MTKVRTTSKPSTKRSLASSKEGLRGIEDIDPRVTIIKETASVIPFIIKTGIVCGLLYFVYDSYTDRFIKKKEVNNYPLANISLSQAQSIADNIYASIGIFSNDFDTVRDSLSGLNYNALVRLYNAFGHKTGTFLSGDLDFLEWLKNQFNDEQIEELEFITNGVLFKI